MAAAVDLGAGGAEPAQPVAEEVFVDAGDGGEAVCGVAVHGGVADGGLAAVAGGGEELFDVGGGEFSGGVGAEFGNGEIGHEADEAGDCGGVGPTAERDDETAGTAFAQVVEEAEGDGAGELVFFGSTVLGDLGSGEVSGLCRPCEVFSNNSGIR